MSKTPMQPLRKTALALALAGAAMALVFGLPQGESLRAEDKFTQGQLMPNAAELDKEGPLKDIWLGDPKAANTIYEYSSLTCGHCAQFHKTVLPQLKTKYIDTGKLRYAVREYPLDNLALIGFMLARCEEKRFSAIVKHLYEHQEEWAFVENPVDKLKAQAKQLGFTDDSFMACVRDQVLLDKIVQMHDRAGTEFDVHSTPTLFVNGHVVRGPRDLADIEKYLNK